MTDFLLQAIAAHQAHNLQDAEKLYVAALNERPNRADAHHNLGLLYAQQGLNSKALQSFETAVSLKSDFGEAWLMISEYARLVHDTDLSVTAGHRATTLLPAMARSWFRYGQALNDASRDSDAAEAYRRALELDPQGTSAWINLSVSLKRVGLFYEAKQAILKAMALSNQTLDTTETASETYGPLHWHLALLELAFDQYVTGFALFRARFKGGTDWRPFKSPFPKWTGQNLADKTILVTTEQGHGDLLMMARYIPLLKAQGAQVILQTHEALKRYFKDWDPTYNVISHHDIIPAVYDFHVPIFDLPYRFGTRHDSVPDTVPYLPCGNGAAQQKDRKKIHVGINWAGQRSNPRDSLRSIPLHVFSSLFQDSRCTFFNFTRELGTGDAKVLEEHSVTNLVPQLVDFADTARWLEDMDLVITCDTALAHMAGGLGMRVWVLLPQSPDWRWGLSSNVTPWYPSMRLFRQGMTEQWTDVIHRIQLELKNLL